MKSELNVSFLFEKGSSLFFLVEKMKQGVQDYANDRIGSMNLKSNISMKQQNKHQ